MRKNRNLEILIIFSILFIFSLGKMLAQKNTTNSDSKDTSQNTAPLNLAQAAANPIANMISLPFQFNFNYHTGQFDRSQTVLNFQPVLPFRLSDNWNVITRTIIPLIQQPDFKSNSGSTYGIGNINFNTFFVPQMIGNFTYGFGLSMIIPSASAPELGGSAFGLGPTIVALYMPGNWVVGVTAGQTWSYKSPDGSAGLNSFFGQYFITYNIKKGWFINTTPTITANFNASEGQQWTVPVGAGFGKLHKFNKLPVKFMLQYYVNVVQPKAEGTTVLLSKDYDVLQPTGSGASSLVFQIVFIFPHKAKK